MEEDARQADRERRDRNRRLRQAYPRLGVIAMRKWRQKVLAEATGDGDVEVAVRQIDRAWSLETGVITEADVREHAAKLGETNELERGLERIKGMRRISTVSGRIFLRDSAGKVLG